MSATPIVSLFAGAIGITSALLLPLVPAILVTGIATGLLLVVTY